MADLVTTAEQRQQYADDGVTVVRGAFDPIWVERLRAVADRSMGERTPLTREYDSNAGGRFHAATFRWLGDPDLDAFVRESPAGRIAGELMGATTVSFFFDHLLVKEPGTDNPTPWHQDLPYWPVLGDQICSLWFALDTVDDDNGAVRYVAGSHRETTWYRAQSFGGGDKYSDESMPPAPDPDLAPEVHRTVELRARTRRRRRPPRDDAARRGRQPARDASAARARDAVVRRRRHVRPPPQDDGTPVRSGARSRRGDAQRPLPHRLDRGRVTGTRPAAMTF